MDTMAVGVVVPAAGRGSRLNSGENKIWLRVAGRTLLEWTLQAFDSHPAVHAIVVASAEVEVSRIRAVAERYPKVSAVVAGGATRAESVGCGLAALSAECDIVLVHDAARPAVGAELITRVIDATNAAGAAVPGLSLTDTIKRVDADGRIMETVPRTGLWAVQTPQGARAADFRDAYVRLGSRLTELTDEASVLEAAGFAVQIVDGEETNIKVTVPGDIERAERVLGNMGVGVREYAGERATTHTTIPPFSQTVRTGFGYDVHAFAEGRELWLGGVRIPHERGLAGHSDADVVLHAVCDALLGAAGMGDIGVLFPDTDAAQKDRASMEFVCEVAARLAGEGWQIANVDIALLAEAPRVGPYRNEMRAAIACGLGIAPTQINIKATTSEKMGFVGRREGLACWAVATITK